MLNSYFLKRHKQSFQICPVYIYIYNNNLGKFGMIAVILFLLYQN